MKKIIFILGLLQMLSFSGATAAVQSSPSSTGTSTASAVSSRIKAAEAPWSTEVTYQLESRTENVSGISSQNKKLNGFFVSTGKGAWFGTLERAQVSEESGNSTLHVSRQYEQWFFGGQMRTRPVFKYLRPFFSAGFGWTQESIDSYLYDSKESDQSQLYKAGYGGTGIMLEVPWFTVALEARLLFSEKLDPSPLLSGVGRIGVKINW